MTSHDVPCAGCCTIGQWCCNGCSTLHFLRHSYGFQKQFLRLFEHGVWNLLSLVYLMEYGKWASGRGKNLEGLMGFLRYFGGCCWLSWMIVIASSVTLVISYRFSLNSCSGGSSSLSKWRHQLLFSRASNNEFMMLVIGSLSVSPQVDFEDHVQVDLQDFQLNRLQI